MPMQAITPPPGMQYPDMMDRPDTPLSAYSPGVLARLSAQQRAQLLKKKKGMMPNPAMMTPGTMLSDGGQ